MANSFKRGVFLYEGNEVVSSLEFVGSVYTNHSSVLDVIRKAERSIKSPLCKENLIASCYSSIRNKKLPMYLLTFTGCSMLLHFVGDTKKTQFKQKCSELFTGAKKNEAKPTEQPKVVFKENVTALEKVAAWAPTDLGVFLKDGKPMVSSRKVAAVFEKRHKDVLWTIRHLECSAEFNGRNFTPVEYQDNKGEMRPEIFMTRDGFTFLAVGFTGKRAAEFKEKYIAAFNAMEAQLASKMQPQATGRGVYIPNFNDPIAAARAWIDAQKENKLLVAKIDEYKPKAEYADAVDASETDISMNAMAKFISQNGYIVGQNNFFKDCLANDLIMKKDGEYWPTQYASELKIFRIKQSPVVINGALVLKHTLRVTVKGQKYFIKKYLGNDLLPPPSDPNTEGQLPLANNDDES